MVGTWLIGDLSEYFGDDAHIETNLEDASVIDLIMEVVDYELFAIPTVGLLKARNGYRSRRLGRTSFGGSFCHSR